MDLEQRRQRLYAQVDQLAVRTMADHGEEVAADLMACCADAFIRALGHIAGPQEARDRLEQYLGSLPVPRGGKPELVVNNVA